MKKDNAGKEPKKGGKEPKRVETELEKKNGRGKRDKTGKGKE